MDDPTAETIEALDAELEALYHHDCGHDHEPVAAVDTQHAQAIAQAFNKVIDEYWKFRTVGEAFAPFVLSIGNLLWEGLNKSFINYDKTDHTALAFMRSNVFAFSAAKSLVEMRQLSNLVVNKNKVRSFEEFKTEALKVHQTYNVRYLRTEYNHVVGSGQMARKYLEAQADKHVFPLLRWDAVKDERTRSEHARLDGITLRADEPLLKSYWPPAGYNCRCDIQQLTSGKETPQGKALEKFRGVINKQSQFFGNTALTGNVFAMGHPYFKQAGTDKDTVYGLKPHQYGLKPIEAIYQQDHLPSLPKGFEKQEQWQAYFSKLYQEKKGKNGDITLTDVLKRPLLMNVRVISERNHSQLRPHLGNAIMDVLTKPDEVFSNYHKGLHDRKEKLTYAYIKYYQAEKYHEGKKYYEDKPVILIAEPEGTNLRMKTLFELTKNQVRQYRRGVLHYVDR